MLEKIRIAVPDIIREKKEWLEEEFGDASDYSIEGIVVVGSVAAGTERPDSDVDLYVLAKEEGYDDDFIEELSRRLDVPIDHINTIRSDLGEEFDPQDWDEIGKEKGYYHTDWKIVMSDDL